MKEKDTRPITCWFDQSGNNCQGELKPYGFVEDPTRKTMDACDFHIKPFGAETRPWTPEHFEEMRFDPGIDKWEQIGLDIAKIEKTCFGDKGWTPERLREEFLKPSNMAVYVLSTTKNLIVGYTMAERRDEETAYVSSTAILPSYRKKGHLGRMMDRLESEMRHRGYKYMERDVAVGNGYANAIERHFGDRIVAKSEHDSEFGLQRFFRIRL